MQDRNTGRQGSVSAFLQRSRTPLAPRTQQSDFQCPHLPSSFHLGGQPSPVLHAQPQPMLLQSHSLHVPSSLMASAHTQSASARFNALQSMKREQHAHPASSLQVASMLQQHHAASNLAPSNTDVVSRAACCGRPDAVSRSAPSTPDVVSRPASCYPDVVSRMNQSVMDVVPHATSSANLTLLTNLRNNLSATR